MADTNLSTAIATLKTKILAEVGSANINQIASYARAARSAGLDEDSEIETAINNRIDTLAASADATGIRTLGGALKQLKNAPVSAGLINNTDDILEGTQNTYYTDARVHSLLNGNLAGHIIPDTNISYDLGSAEYKFRHLYLDSNTLFLGDTELSVDNSKVTVDGTPLPTQVGELSNVDLEVSPETLVMQVDAPEEGHAPEWKWTWEQSALPFSRLKITNETQLNVPLYMEGVYQINNFTNSLHGNMTQTHGFKLKWIEGAGDANLIDWVTYSEVPHSHPDIDGGATHTVQRLSINVPSEITLPVLNAPNVTYDVGSTTGAYVFSGTQSGQNPEIGPFYRGGTYTININASGHPFYFTTNNGTGFVSGGYVGEYTDGVTGSRTDVGTITFTVPQSAPDTLFYQCGIHGVMRGSIRVKDLAVETNENGNTIIYGQHSQDGHVQKMEIRPLPALSSQMCLVYDATTGKFVPQDLATYVENTPAFENKIKEVAGTATLVAPDGTSLVASVEIYNDASYLPLLGNTSGDIAFATDTSKLYVWDGTQWNDANPTPDSTKYVSLTQSGDLVATTGTKRWYAPKNLTISNITARVDTAPEGSDINITVNKVSGGTTTTENLSIGASAVKGTASVSLSMLEDDYLTVDITQVGSTTPGAELRITFTYQ